MEFFGILAEAATDSTLLRDAGQAVSTISGFGFAVWYAWYMTTSRIPAIEKIHGDQLTESERRHENHIALLIQNFRADLDSMWKQKREDDAQLSAAIDRLTESINRDPRHHAARP